MRSLSHCRYSDCVIAGGVDGCVCVCVCVCVGGGGGGAVSETWV